MDRLKNYEVASLSARWVLIRRVDGTQQFAAEQQGRIILRPDDSGAIKFDTPAAAWIWARENFYLLPR